MVSLRGDEAEDHLDFLDLGLPPLPEEVYPRIIPQRTPGNGYYVALAVSMSVWMITPGSCAYLIWYAIIGQGLSGYTGLTCTILAGYSLTEVVFSFYIAYLIRLVQRPAPPSTLPLDRRNALFRKVLAADLTYPRPSRPRSKPGDVEREMEREMYKMYERGHVTASEYHHVVDRHYEETHGIRERRRVGKMSEVQKEVIAAFVEEDQGEREERLRKEIEGDVGTNPDYDEDGIVDRDGNVILLHRMDRRAVEFRERLRTWFNHAPWESIKRDNVLVWLSWSCFNIEYDRVKEDEDQHNFLLTSLAMLEARTGTIFEEGYNPKVEIIRLTLDPVNARGRPLILYALANFVNWVLQTAVYPSYGMSMYTEGDITYLIRIPKGWTSEAGATNAKSMPIVYMHGLGFGLLQSHLLIKRLLTTLSTHPILIPIAPHTSQAVFHPRHLRPWSRPELVDGLKAICKRWGFWEETRRGPLGGVSMLSHSNGSVAHAWILKDCPSLIKRNTFVDPVCFCLWEGDICHSFCYRKPTSALEILLYYFIASEVGIAHYIQRHFDWADNNLFVDEIPRSWDPSRTAFFFGAQDIIIDTARARRYLEKHGLRSNIHWDEHGGHGDGLSGESLESVIKYIGTGSTQGWTTG